MDWQSESSIATTVIGLLTIFATTITSDAAYIKEGTRNFEAGSPFNLTCIGHGLLGWHYPDSVRKRVKQVKQPNRLLLIVNDSRTEDTGYYHCYEQKITNFVDSTYVFVFDPVNAFHLKGKSLAEEGENVTMTCVASKHIFTNDITWWFKEANGQDFQQIHRQKDMLPVEFESYTSFENTLNMYNVSHRKHKGQYLCKVMRGQNHPEYGVKSVPVSSNVITLSINETIFPNFQQQQKDPYYISHIGKTVFLDCRVHNVNGCEIQWFKEGKRINFQRINPHYDFGPARQSLIIKVTETSDKGIYECLVKNFAGSIRRNFNVTIFNTPPVVTIQSEQEFYLNGKTYHVRCEIKPHPITNVTWSFTNCTDYTSCAKNEIVIRNESMTPNREIYKLEVKALTSGLLYCEACNIIGCRKESIRLFIADYEDEVHLNGQSSANEGTNVTLRCVASKYNFTKGITWWFKRTNGKDFQHIHSQKDVHHAEEFESLLSIKSYLKMYNVSHTVRNGQYLCKAMSRQNHSKYGVQSSPVSSNVITLRINVPPVVSIQSKQEFYMKGKAYHVDCKIESYPIAKVTWSFTNCTDYTSCAKNEIVIRKENMRYNNQETYKLEVKALTSGMLHCKACNIIGCKKESHHLIIAALPVVTILSEQVFYMNGKTYQVKCNIESYPIANVTWYFTNCTDYTSCAKNEIVIRKENMRYNQETYKLEVKALTSGMLHCRACNIIGCKKESHHLIIADHEDILHLNDHSSAAEGENITLTCVVSKYNFTNGISWWFKEANGKDFQQMKSQKDMHLEFVSNQSTKSNMQMYNVSHLKHNGEYLCKAMIIQNHPKYGPQSSPVSSNVITLRINVGQSPSLGSSCATVGIAIAVVGILLIALAYLIWRIKKNRKRAQTFTIHDVTAFHEGTLLTVDPDLAIDEQADLLPYIKDFDFPRKKLKFGKQLGTGAFGKVVKAEAEGLKEGENITIVAVKMVKPHSDISHLKALMTELKILIYIGHHVNVLNLLGACTTNLIHKELFVILEYCRYGNLHSYLQQHRESFINQIDPLTDLVDSSIGKDTMPCKEEVSLKPSGETSKESRVTFDNSSGQVLYSDTTGENSMSTMADSSRSSNPADLRWSIMYKADFKGKLAAPLNTKDLLCWSYQVAMGMEYLASLKVVHADLAASNILLADDNIVKICDLGLARNRYMSMDDKKKVWDLLPIKWMAIESIEDRIFSTKSDVWSFGVVLWELFSLARTPYPGVEVNEEFLQQLIKGTRMAKPEYSTHEMYRVMLGCWKAKPSERPSFKDLVHRIGDSLDSDIKLHYLELNTPNVNQNIKATARNTCVNYCDESNSEYIEHQFPEHVYVNFNQPDDAKFKKINRVSEEESDNPAFEDEAE